jgi:hypothetical protein
MGEDWFRRERGTEAEGHFNYAIPLRVTSTINADVRTPISHFVPRQRKTKTRKDNS